MQQSFIESASFAVHKGCSGATQAQSSVQDALQQVHTKLPPPFRKAVSSGRLWLHQVNGTFRCNTPCSAGTIPLYYVRIIIITERIHARHVCITLLAADPCA